MHNRIMKEIKENPIVTNVVSVFAAIVCTALTVFITSSFATVGYVDREIAKVEKQGEKREKRIEQMIKTMDNRVYEMWKKVPKQ